jgi:hypothetical protein
MFRDEAGSTFIPHEVAEQLSAAAARLVRILDQLVGKGIVGAGFARDPWTTGRSTGPGS